MYLVLKSVVKRALVLITVSLYIVAYTVFQVYKYLRQTKAALSHVAIYSTIPTIHYHHGIRNPFT